MKYETPEDMEIAIKEFFVKCKEERLWPTVCGLTLHLGFGDRSSLIDYQEKDEFSHTIKKAKLSIEAALEQRLFDNSPAGVIFNLKNNFGWKDKKEFEGTVDHTMTKLMNEINGDD